MLEDTNSLDGAHMIYYFVINFVIAFGSFKYLFQWKKTLLIEPRQANLCLRAFRHDKF